MRISDWSSDVCSSDLAAGLPRSLREIGMPQAGIAIAADMTLTTPYWNPRPLERDSIRHCLGRAWAGAPPATAPGIARKCHDAATATDHPRRHNRSLLPPDNDPHTPLPPPEYGPPSTAERPAR